MEEKLIMCDFVHGGCTAVKEPKGFVAIWVKSNGYPCIVCDVDHSECRFHKVRVDGRTVVKKLNTSTAN
jgi:hypothetical protein